MPAEPAEKWVIRIGSENPIEDLIVNPQPVLKKNEKDGKLTFQLKGNYYREGWKLFANEKRIYTDPSGLFTLEIPWSTETAKVELRAEGPRKKIQKETLGIVIPKEELIRQQEVVNQKQELPPAAPAEFLNLKRVYFGGVAAIQDSARQKSYSPFFGWSPSYTVSTHFGLRGGLDFFAFAKRGAGSFAVTHLGIFGELFPIWDLYVGIGPAMQVWWAFGGIKPVAQAELGYSLKLPIVWGISLDRIGAELVWFFDNARTKELKLAFHFQF